MEGQCYKSYDTENSSSQYLSAEQTTQCIKEVGYILYMNGDLEKMLTSLPKQMRNKATQL